MNCIRFIVILIYISQVYPDAAEIHKIIDCFAGKNSEYKIERFMNKVDFIRVGVKYYFGIHQASQGQIDYPEFKTKIMQLRGLKNRRTIQLIGDSNQFTIDGSNFTRDYCRKLFVGDHILEYGYTGYLRPNGELDVNSFLNEYLNDYPNQESRVIANVVGHTVVALEKWGCRVSPHVINFVVVYNNDGMDGNFTKFGDDVVASDHFLSKSDEDSVICLEGGAQSFNQSIRSLSIGLPVTFIKNIRKAENEVFFSAARFIGMVKSALLRNPRLSPKDVKAIYTRYDSTLQSIWDEKRPDHRTKKVLFEQAINEFIDTGIYHRVLDFCKIIDYKA